LSNAYCERAGQVNPKAGGAWVQLLISGLVIYILAAGAGLAFMMYPDASRQAFGDIRRAFLQYAPQSSQPRLPELEPPAITESPTTRKPVQRPVHVRPVIRPVNGSFGVQVINVMQPESPVRNNSAVTVTIDDDQLPTDSDTHPRLSNGPAR
jgi:hypothetical protein